MNKKLTLKKAVIKNLGDSDMSSVAGAGFFRRAGRFFRGSGLASMASRAITGDRSQRIVNRASLAASTAVSKVTATPTTAASQASVAAYSAATGQIIDT